MEFDILIRNAKIVDGSGVPGYKGDIGIIGEKIQKIGELSSYPSKYYINANNKIVSPGFIDTHTHFDLVPFAFGEFQDPLLKMRLYQGITTQVAGCCGNSMAPITKQNKQEWLIQRTSRVIRRYQEVHWETFEEFLNELGEQKLGTNYAFYVGHSTIRYNVMGFSSKLPNIQQMSRMKELLHDSIKEGAFGLSTGLVYSPGIFSNTEELIELCSVLSDYKAIYASHIRSDTAKFLEAVEELVKIAEKNHIPGQIHHVKVRKRNSTREIMDKFFDIVNSARNRGVDIMMEVYPYNASWLGLDTLMLPVWAREGGIEKTMQKLQDKSLILKMKKETCKLRNWNNEKEIIEDSKDIILVAMPSYEKFVGKTLFEISKIMGYSPFEAAIEIIKLSRLEASVVYVSLKEEDLVQFLKYPFTMIGSDSVPTKAGWSAHPRNNGTFPRILARYVRDKKILSLEEAIHKMTGLSAKRFQFNDRGLLKEGYKADIVVFDENKIQDTATYTEPFNKPKGIEYVIVNGCISIEKGEFTGRTNGKVIRR